MLLRFGLRFGLLALCIAAVKFSAADPLINQREQENELRNEKYNISSSVLKMTSRIPLNGTKGWQELSHLQKHPTFFDVAFAVGPDRVLVRASKMFLTLASPVFERELEGRWKNAEGDEMKEISLPDLNPEAFKLFVELVILDCWSVGALTALELPSDQLLHLMSVCHKYGMTTALKNLTELAKDFLRDFGTQVKPEDFLLLSQAQLESILARDELSMKEIDVFNYACRWATAQCQRRAMEVTGTNVRTVLGPVLFQIRFPLMSIKEFSKVLQWKGLLSVEEIVDIVRIMAEDRNSSMSNGITKFKFRMVKRMENAFASTPLSSSSTEAPTNSTTTTATPTTTLTSTTTATTTLTTTTTEKETSTGNPLTSVPAGTSTVSLAQVLSVVDSPFVCDGAIKTISFNMRMKIALKGLGFLGPIDNDSFYDVTVQVKEYNPNYSELTNKMEKRIFAEKSKTFYFIFDQPLVLDAIPHDHWENYYFIHFSLKGPNTRSLKYEYWVTKRIYDGSKEFVIELYAPQLVEIVYSTV